MKKFFTKNSAIKNAFAHICQKANQSSIFLIRIIHSFLEELIYGVTCAPTKIEILFKKRRGFFAKITTMTFHWIKNLFGKVFKFVKLQVEMCRCIFSYVFSKILNCAKFILSIIKRAFRKAAEVLILTWKSFKTIACNLLKSSKNAIFNAKEISLSAIKKAYHNAKNSFDKINSKAKAISKKTSSLLKFDLLSYAPLKKFFNSISKYTLGTSLNAKQQVLVIVKHPVTIIAIALSLITFIGFRTYDKQMTSINYSNKKLAEKKAEILAKHKKHSIAQINGSDNISSKLMPKKKRVASKNTSDFQKFVDDFFSSHKVSEVMCSGGNCKMKIDNKIVDNNCVLCEAPELVIEEATDDYIVFADVSGNKCAKSITSLLE